MKIKNSLLFFSALIIIIGSCGGEGTNDKDKTSAPMGEEGVSKMVFTFYYGWYGNPEVSGRWLAWDEPVDTLRKNISNMTHYPQLGPYDSRNPEVVQQHCTWAKETGIDVFIASWFGPDGTTDKSLPLVLESAEEQDLKVTAYYETTRDSREQGLEDLIYLLDNYTDHPAWLRINGQPVVFVYARAINQIGLDGWEWMIQEVNQQRSPKVIFIGDRISEESAEIFDGIHTYNITGSTYAKTVPEIRAWAQETFPEWVETAGDKISCITIIPEFDDRYVGRDDPRPITVRHNGETYRVLWEEAIAADPDWILITSFNEWYEGSEIEPSYENHDRELKTTTEFTSKFKAGN